MKRSISNKKYKKIISKDKDCFNYPQVKKTHSVLKEGNFWLIIKNKYPYLKYDNLKVEKHLLIIPKRKIINWGQIKKDELKEFFDLAQISLGFMDLKEVRVIMKTNLNKPSIKKIHAHILFLKTKKSF